MDYPLLSHPQCGGIEIPKSRGVGGGRVLATHESADGGMGGKARSPNQSQYKSET
jgi:hypothetical protein